MEATVEAVLVAKLMEATDRAHTTGMVEQIGTTDTATIAIGTRATASSQAAPIATLSMRWP